MTNDDNKNREEWLEEAVEELRPLFQKVGYPIPVKLRVACGWPSTGALASKQKRVGECWQPEASEDNIPQIFISPAVSDDVEVLGILVHELIHAMGIRGHRKDFKKVAMLVGLEGKMTATTIGAKLNDQLIALNGRIGPYPHATLNSNNARKKQTTRMLKAWCPECGYTVRVSRKWLEIDTPTCTPCQIIMECDLWE